MTAENPAIIITPADVWTKVATAAQVGYIAVKSFNVLYYHTYKLTGESKPDDLILPGDPDFIGVPIYYRLERIATGTVPVGGVTMGAVTPVDFYVYAVDAEGSVIVSRGV